MFNKSPSLIGAVHLKPLPGAAGYCGSVDEIVASAVSDAKAYIDSGFDGVILENMHDAPYLKGFVYPETLASMTVVAGAVKDIFDGPLGVQLLAGANIEALAVANALNLDFIRVEGFVYAHVADEGIHEASSPELIRKRFDLRAERIKIFADIKKKHSSHSITEDVSLCETACAAEMFQADAVVVTGASTGQAPMPNWLQDVKGSVDIPVLVGSGVTAENIEKFLRFADALIIGSFAKHEGKWQNPVDPERCKLLVETSRSIKR